MLVQVGDDRPDGVFHQVRLVHGIHVFLADALHDFGEQFDRFGRPAAGLGPDRVGIHHVETHKRCQSQHGTQQYGENPL